MDQHEKTALGLELYRIAAGKPGKGLPVLERGEEICRKLFEDDCRPRLRRELKGLRSLMADWTQEEGWWSQDVDHEDLREKLNARIDRVLEIATAATANVRSPRLTAPTLQLRPA